MKIKIFIVFYLTEIHVTRQITKYYISTQKSFHSKNEFNSDESVTFP